MRASRTHECNPLPPIRGLHIKTGTAATLTVVVGCFVATHIMEGLQELKPMTKDYGFAQQRDQLRARSAFSC
jgi:hypothetical protein